MWRYCEGGMVEIELLHKDMGRNESCSGHQTAFASNTMTRDIIDCSAGVYNVSKKQASKSRPSSIVQVTMQVHDTKIRCWRYLLPR